MTEPAPPGSGAAIAMAGVAGLAGVALYLVAAVLIVDLPKMDEPGAAVRAYVADHRARVLAATVAWTAATVATAFLMVGLFEATKRVRGYRAWSAFALLAGLLLSAIELVAFSVLATLAYRDPGSPETARLLADLVFIALALAGLPTAAWTGVASMVMLRGQIGRRWLAWLGFATAVIHVGAAFALARSGFWSPSGPLAYAAPVSITAWVGLVALLLATAWRPFPGRALIQGVIGRLA